jgi:hypothetical protein
MKGGKTEKYGTTKHKKKYTNTNIQNERKKRLINANKQSKDMKHKHRDNNIAHRTHRKIVTTV